MLQADPPFRPVGRRDGYLALEDMGLIGDGTTSALVGLDGSIPWLCLPRFDSEPLFCGLLDAASGGCFTVAPENVIEARQRYEPDTAVLVTELRSPTGVLAVTDAMALYPAAVLSEDAPGRAPGADPFGSRAPRLDPRPRRDRASGRRHSARSCGRRGVIFQQPEAEQKQQAMVATLEITSERWETIA